MTECLIKFLKDLANDLENGMLTSNQINTLSDFKNSYTSDNQEKNDLSKFDSEEAKDLFRIFIAVLYLYRLAKIYDEK